MAATIAGIMSRKIVSVTPDTPIRDIAGLLSQHAISAVPVIGKDGTLLGMVSEGDLMAPFSTRNQTRRDWWLEMLAEGERLAPEFLDYINADRRTAADVMIRKIISVNEDAAVGDVADILMKHRIKRVPVLHDGRVVGIVSRADIVRSLATGAGH